ncbi:MAG TPA: HAMP domain-containing sensor histidine kinase [Bosea sp. (in: a-proteobacteria)]|uniref:sensor histidine kinase n=1 Tax=Bosea sp. (in: a-proteobacteria) TaxID=1871050 RepID=UPI002E12F41F|nr:HAMP domain-containing sensor histidine kinase [Bosea sp. (in: a-proteobacteria)]
MALVRNDAVGNRYILPGLYLADAAQPFKRFHGYKAQFSMSQVEGYLEKHLAWEEEVRKRTESELTALVHDLRHLSGSIYHSAVEAERFNSERDWSKTAEGIRTIIASQTMLRVRIDYLDFANAVQRFDETEKIPVFSRVDKVIRCFRASAKHKSIDIHLGGESYRLAVGPNILDIVPYTLIENAIKYAPRGSRVSVNVSDTEAETVVKISSLGPLLLAGEQDKIFERGVRGGNAAKVVASGTGLGLAVARNVIDLFGGALIAVQSKDVDYREEVPFAEIEFRFTLPTSGEDHVRKTKFGRRKMIRF